MTRITTVFVACLALALSGATVALAKHGADDTATTTTTTTTATTTTPTHGELTRSRNLYGQALVVDATAKTFDLRVDRRNGSLRRGVTVKIVTTDATKYKKLSGFSAIVVGDSYKVKVRRAADGTLTAIRVERKRAHQHSVDDNRHGLGSSDSKADDHGNHRGRDHSEDD